MTEHRRMKPLLGTFVEIGADAPDTVANSAIEAGFGAIQTIHTLASLQDPDSELSRLNRAQGEEIELHPLRMEGVIKSGLSGMLKLNSQLFHKTQLHCV